MGLFGMIAGLALFFAAHTLTTHRKMRARMLGAVGGEHVYKIVYSLVSLIGLALIIWGFAHYRAVGLWLCRSRVHLRAKRGYCSTASG